MQKTKVGKTILLILHIVVILVLSACGRKPNISQTDVSETPGNTAVMQGVRLEIGGVFVSEPDSNGWKQVSIPLISSSVTSNAFVAGSMCGLLIDTGGHRHEVTVPGKDTLLWHLPSVRINELVAYSQVPQNQDVKRLELYQDYNGSVACKRQMPGEPWEFDLTASPVNVSIPVDNWESIPEDGVLEFEVSSVYKLQILGGDVEENRVYDYYYWVPTWHIENIGGHNIRFRRMGTDGMTEPVLAMVDDRGRYTAVDLRLSGANGIGPGIKMASNAVIGPRIDRFTDSKWVLLMLVTGNAVSEAIRVEAPKLPAEEPVQQIEIVAEERIIFTSDSIRRLTSLLMSAQSGTEKDKAIPMGKLVNLAQYVIDDFSDYGMWKDNSLSFTTPELLKKKILSDLNTIDTHDRSQLYQLRRELSEMIKRDRAKLGNFIRPSAVVRLQDGRKTLVSIQLYGQYGLFEGVLLPVVEQFLEEGS